MPSSISRSLLLLTFGFGLLTAGCAPTGPTVRYDRRVPDARHASHRAPSRVYARVSRDAHRYVRDLDRTLRLDRRQEARIEHLLTDRAIDHLRRSRSPRYANLFPRRYDDRATRDWWHHADKRIERELNRRQRHAYRDLVRYETQRARRDPRGSRHRDHDNGRHRGRGGD